MTLSKSLVPLRRTPALPVRAAGARDGGPLPRGAAGRLPLAAAFLLALCAGANAQGVVPTVPQFTVADASATEGDAITFTVTLALPSTQPTLSVAVPVGYATTPGTAGTADFTGIADGTVMFPASAANGATQTFMIATLEDTLAEDHETFTVTLSPPPPEVLSVQADDTATGTITDDELLTISLRDPPAVDEGEIVTFQASIDGVFDLQAPLTVAYEIVPGTATADDYTDVTGGTVTFPAARGATGGGVQNIEIMATADGLGEPAETFSVTLSAAGFPGAVRLNRATANGTINASAADVMAEVSITDASAEEGAPVVFTVRLSATPGADVQLQYSTSPGTAGADDFTPATNVALMTFAATAAGADLSQTFEIATADDEEEEGDETFTVTLSARDGTTLPQGVTLARDPLTATGTIRGDAMTGDVETRLGRANDALLPHVASAMMSSTVSAIAGRANADGGDPSSQASNLAGTANLLQALKAGESGLENDTLDLEQVLGGSSFVMSLNAAGNGRAGDLVVWGSGDYRRLSGPDGSALDWDGNMFGVHLGADVRVRPDLLAGVAVSRFSGSFDYTDSADPVAVKGDYASRMTSLHPYASWSPAAGAGLWATAGWGRGEVTISEENLDWHSGDTEFRAVAAGADSELLADDGMLDGGTTTLRLRGDAALARIEIDDEGRIRSEDYNVRRLRVALEGSYECTPAAGGGCLAPSLEVGVRHDGGDARTGIGVELGGALRYTDRAAGVTVQGRGRALVADRDDHGDWGIEGLIVVDPGADGRGMSLSLTPGYGASADTADRLYDSGGVDLTAGDDRPGGHLDTEIGYGFRGWSGVVTPYTGVSLADEGARSYRAGVRFRAGPAFSVSLEGRRREKAAAAADSSTMARGSLRW